MFYIYNKIWQILVHKNSCYLLPFKDAVFVEREVNTHVTLTFRIIHRSSGGRDPTSLTFATGLICHRRRRVGYTGTLSN